MFYSEFFILIKLRKKDKKNKKKDKYDSRP